jgi:hypothetical protein
MQFAETLQMIDFLLSELFHVVCLVTQILDSLKPYMVGNI